MGTASTRPRPAVSDDTRFFWDGVRAGEFRIQRCAGCGSLRHPPRPMCPRCQSLEWDHVLSAGRGVVHAFAVHHKPALPYLASPFVVAVVELAEGVRYVGNVIGCDPGEVRIGLPVEVVYERYDDDLVLPQFRLVGGAR